MNLFVDAKDGWEEPPAAGLYFKIVFQRPAQIIVFWHINAELTVYLEPDLCG